MKVSFQSQNKNGYLVLYDDIFSKLILTLTGKKIEIPIFWQLFFMEINKKEYSLGTKNKIPLT